MDFECLYIHVPFCSEKCDYCAFYSEPCGSSEKRRLFLEKVDDELTDFAKHLQKLRTVFIGGGTPSVLTVDELGALLSSLRKHCSFAHLSEFTAEANPESLSSDKLELLARYGVNRLSLGIQSFSCELRKTLGRRGSIAQLPEIMERARKLGLDNINLDMIYIIPGQNMTSWAADLKKALAWQPTHLSTYELTREPGTLFAEVTIDGDSSDNAVKMWRQTDKISGSQGLRRYEVSNFARPGWECRHNDLIWHGATYLGCGPAAASFDGRRRWCSPESLESWLRNVPPETDEISPEARALEILAVGLRTKRGWEATEFSRRTGFDCWRLRGKELQELQDSGLLEMVWRQYVRPSERGLLFADSIGSRLI